MKNIAVENGLKPVANILNDAGYKVHEFDTRQKSNKDFLDGFDAVVISGIDENFMGIQDTINNIPIIEAKGRTPEDIKRAIEQRVQH